MGTRTTLQPVFESVKTDHATVHGSVPHRHSTSKVRLCLRVSGRNADLDLGVWHPSPNTNLKLTLTITSAFYP